MFRVCVFCRGDHASFDCEFTAPKDAKRLKEALAKNRSQPKLPRFCEKRTTNERTGIISLRLPGKILLKEDSPTEPGPRSRTSYTQTGLHMDSIVTLEEHQQALIRAYQNGRKDRKKQTKQRCCQKRSARIWKWTSRSSRATLRKSRTTIETSSSPI